MRCGCVDVDNSAVRAALLWAPRTRAAAAEPAPAPTGSRARWQRRPLAPCHHHQAILLVGVLGGAGAGGDVCVSVQDRCSLRGERNSGVALCALQCAAATNRASGVQGERPASLITCCSLCQEGRVTRAAVTDILTPV
jgi:hypothetical protein